MCPGEMASFASAPLLDKRGKRSTAPEAGYSHHLEDCRAADVSEQAQYAAQFNGKPQPWYCVIGSLYKSVKRNKLDLLCFLNVEK
jgi:hypothetical protein